jgi:hypothetical protein
MLKEWHRVCSRRDKPIAVTLGKSYQKVGAMADWRVRYGPHRSHEHARAEIVQRNDGTIIRNVNTNSCVEEEEEEEEEEGEDDEECKESEKTQVNNMLSWGGGS